VKFLPIAGITGDNILREVDEARCPWWKQMYNTAGHNTTTPTLISTLDSLALGGRDPDAPLRIPCLDRYFERGCVVLGKVESGTLRRGDEIMISPTRKKTKVEAIYIDEKSVSYAKPGENVLIKFNINVEDIQKGFVLSPADAPCPSVVEVRVQAALVDMLEHRPLFSPGYDCVLHVHTVEIEATCSALEFVIEKGKQMRRPFGRTGQQCVARLKLPISTCMETFAKLPAMGRFTLRDEGKTIAIGKIVDLVK
jgi:peptide chain release factor subunit 3